VADTAYMAPVPLEQQQVGSPFLPLLFSGRSSDFGLSTNSEHGRLA
jgi:hypothetical protein